MTVTTPKDIGKLTADILFTHPADDQIFFTAGEAITYGRLADLAEAGRRRSWDQYQ